MKKLLLITASIFIFSGAMAQTTLTEAVDFYIKTIYSEPIYLFPILDDENQIVVIDFFSTTCGPCQEYAPHFQACYEKFGYNEGNVYFMGINWGNNNEGVMEFDSIFGLTYPTASGSEGGGNLAFGEYDILSYPTVIVITPDHTIVEQYIWLPNEENITNAVIAAGGILVGTDEVNAIKSDLFVYPNPVNNTGTINFEVKSTSNINLAIFNLLGKKVYSSQKQVQQHGKAQMSFSVAALKNGYYFLKLTSDKGDIATTRIIVAN